MPLVQIDVLRGRAASEKKALFDAVHAALVGSLKIPDDDRVQTLVEHDEDDFDAPSPTFTLVTITMFPGRSIDAKRALYQALVAALGEVGIPSNDVSVVLQEPPMENWGIRRGTPASEVELGFELDV